MNAASRAVRPTNEVSQLRYHGPESRYGTRKKCKFKPQPPDWIDKYTAGPTSLLANLKNAGR